MTTNADKIRQMSDEELADLLDNSVEFFSCDECLRATKGKHECCPDCRFWILEFLQQEAE